MSKIRRRPVSVTDGEGEAVATLLTLHAVPAPEIAVFDCDADVLVALLTEHAPANAKIVDVTHNTGKMWRGLAIDHLRVDRNPALKESGDIDIVADFNKLPLEDHSYDVIVFDPPHISDSGKNGIAGGGSGAYGKAYGHMYGTDVPEVHVKGRHSVSHLFPPFLAEAKRVLRSPDGIVLVKIADQVHGGAYQWQHMDLRDAAVAAGMTMCDMKIVVKMNRGGLVDPKWKHVYHTRSVHCFWIAIRNASGPNACMSRFAPEVERDVTERMFDGGPEFPPAIKDITF